MIINDFNIGKEVFCTDVKKKKVFSGLLVGINVVYETGYLIAKVYNKNLHTDRQLEMAHVHKTKEAADKFLEDIIPSLREAEELAKAFKVALDEKRTSIIGKPEFKELSDFVKNTGAK